MMCESIIYEVQLLINITDEKTGPADVQRILKRDEDMLAEFLKRKIENHLRKNGLAVIAIPILLGEDDHQDEDDPDETGIVA